MVVEITTPRVMRAKWSSERAFVLATAAAAIGLGNLWRFPYIAGENGGGAFVLAYVLSVIVLGIPLMIIEIAAGRTEDGGPVKTFRAIHRRAAPLGWAVVGLTMLIMSYYLVITGWTLGYAFDSLSGSVVPFQEFTSDYRALLFFAVVVVLTMVIVARGVKMVERITRVMMPLFFATLLLLTAYSLTLPGAGKAIAFLFAPDFSELLSPTLWALAFGQAFYSLAIGQGLLITYGSFVPENINLPRATGIVAIVETLVALIAGLMIFPIVFTFGLNPAHGSDLAFVTMPLAFENISFGSFIAVPFFSLFFLAAISSSVAGMHVVKTVMREELRLTHVWATAAAFLPILPLGVFAALSFSPSNFSVFGRPFIEVLDLFAANQVLILLGLAGGAVIGWNLEQQVFTNIFGNHLRRYASYVIRIARYLWIVVLAVLIMSFLVE